MPHADSALDGSTGSNVLSPAEPRRIQEVVVCSHLGEVLYSWQCPNAEERLKLMEAIQRKAKHLGNALTLGQADRWELDEPEGRIIAHFQSDCSIWVRVSWTQSGQTD